MLAGNKVSGVPIDMQGGAGPSRVPGQITHEFEEASSAGKFWIEKVGGGRHGRNDARSEVGRILGGEGKVVVAVIVRACEPSCIALVDECAAPLIVVVGMDGVGQASSEGQFANGEGLACWRDRKSVV